MQDAFGQSNVEPSTLQLIIDQLEELIATLVQEIRDRPAVAAAIAAAVAGAVIGGLLAARIRPRRTSPPRQLVRQARGMAEAGDLAALAFKLLQNPIVRGYVRSAIQGQFKKRFSM